MADLEHDLNELMERLSLQASVPHEAQTDVLRRSIRRRIAVPMISALLVVAIGSTVVAAGRPLWANRLQPVAPSPSPTTFDNPGPYSLGDDPATGKEIEIATGERDGLMWRLYAYRDEDGSLCSGHEWANGEGSGCGPWPNEHDINIGLSSGSGNPETMLDGELSYEVAAVEVRLEGEEPFRVPVFPDPASFGVNFFLAFVPNEPRGEVVALAADGSELETASITKLAEWKFLCDEEECSITNPPGPAGPGPNACLGDRTTIEGTEGPDILEGTPGFDVIRGLGGDDVIHGLGDADWICGGAGDDQIFGGDGGDEIWGGPGNDVLAGEGGFDSIVYWDAESGVSVDLSAGTATGEGDDSLSGFEDLGGSKHDDVLVGTEGEDQIEASGGNDRILGLGGDDVIYPDEGDDDVDGGPGRDFFGYSFRLAGPVTVDLSAGTSTGEGNDRMSSIEIIHGTKFDDVLIGSDANESISGREGNDRIFGGGGDDELWGEFPRFTAADYREGGPFMESSDDEIDGGDGDDTIGGGPGSNTCTNGETTTDC